MDTENAKHLSEARLFVRTVFDNISLCYFQKKYKVNGEFSSCKLYSNYCHSVILRYLEINDGVFDAVEKVYDHMLQHPHSKGLVEIEFRNWAALDVPPSNSDLYIHFAKKAILALIGSFHDASIVGKYEEEETQCAMQAIEMDALSENYDITRKKWKTVVNAVYKWFGKSLVQFATVPDIQHGWDESDLSTSAENYFNSRASTLQSEWQRMKFDKEMNKLKFALAVKEMCLQYKKDDTRKESRKREKDATNGKTKFILGASLLSLYCCVNCNFYQAAECVVDILNRIMRTKYRHFFE